MLRNPALPTRVLTAIRKARKWLANEECRYLFCLHPNAILSDAIQEMRRLSASRLRSIARNMKVNPQIRAKASDLTRPRQVGPGRLGGR